VNVVLRGLPLGFGFAVNDTSPLPEELTGLVGVIVTQSPDVLDAFHAHTAGVMTPTVPEPPVEGTEPVVDPSA
jgi:hypothetical protein